jgi:hypothetical protein
MCMACVHLLTALLHANEQTHAQVQISLKNGKLEYIYHVLLC